jgi:hypothetical protein
MSESKQSDHWDLLASVLGAQPQKEASDESVFQTEEKAPQATEEIEENNNPQPPVAEVAVESDATPTRPISSWDALALELGIEVKPEPSPPSAPIQTYMPRQEEKKSAIPTEQPREHARPAPAEFAKNIEPLRTSDASLTVEPAEQSEKKSRHRRRRHRKSKDKDRHKEKTGKQSSESTAESAVQDNMTPSEVLIETSDKMDMEKQDYSEKYAKDGETGKQRSKRRRSHRGSRKRKKKGAETTPEKGMDMEGTASAGCEEPAASTDISRSLGDEVETAKRRDDDDRQETKSGFRAIPTWEEAVGFMVAKNMESRPRRQGNAPPRSRSAETHKRQRK